MKNLAGETVSHYHIIEAIGQGGMGVVYKAEDMLLKRPVALKFLPSDLTRDSEARERFIHEAQSTSALEHTNICSVHEISEYEGQTFIVMGYYDGETLRQKIERGPLPVDEVVDLASQIASGLSKAHAAGIVHRDIKPANVIVTKEGVAKILDFGLAKVTGRTLLTKSGTTLGTAAYMSPEQARGEAVDGRADVWSLGVTMYEMLAGKRPFRSDYDQALVYAILNEEPPPLRTARPEIPEALEQIVLTAMCKSPDERYQSMDQLLADLNLLRSEQLGPTVTHAAALSRRKRRRSFIVGGAALCAGLALAIGAYALYETLFGRVPLIASHKPVVVASFENETGDSTMGYLGNVLQDALITSLEQLSGLRITSRDHITDLQREMGRSGVSFVDMETALDICRREGGGAVLQGNFARAGNLFVTTLKIIDARTGQTRRSFKTTGLGVESLLQSQIDNLSTMVAQNFGVSDSSIHSDLHPIAGMTSSLEAYNDYLYGRRARDNSDYPSAKRLLQKAVQLDSTFAIAWFWLGETFFESGQSQQGEEACNHARRHIQSVPEKERLHAEAHLYPQRYRETILRAIARYPQEKEFYACYATIGCGSDYRARIANFKKAYELDPDYGWALEGLTVAYTRHGEPQEGLKYARLLAKAKPQYPWAGVLAGDAYFALGDLRQAEFEYERGVELRAEALTWAWIGTIVRRGYMFALNEEYDSFLKLLQKGTSESADSQVKHDGMYWKAFLQSWMGMTKAALASYRQIPVIPLVRLGSSWTYLDCGETDSAEACLRSYQDQLVQDQDSLQRYTVFSLSRSLQGVVALNDGKPDLAYQRYKEAMSFTGKLDTGTVEYGIRIYLADLLRANILLARDSVDQAILFMQNTRSWSPSFDRLLYMLVWNAAWNLRDVVARAYAMKGDIGKAIAEYERLCQPFPSGDRRFLIHPLYYYRLAHLYEQKGESHRAFESYEKFLRVWNNADGSHPEIREARKHLGELSRLGSK